MVSEYSNSCGYKMVNQRKRKKFLSHFLYHPYKPSVLLPFHSFSSTQWPSLFSFAGSLQCLLQPENSVTFNKNYVVAILYNDCQIVLIHLVEYVFFTNLLACLAIDSAWYLVSSRSFLASPNSLWSWVFNVWESSHIYKENLA